MPQLEPGGDQAHRRRVDWLPIRTLLVRTCYERLGNNYIGPDLTGAGPKLTGSKPRPRHLENSDRHAPARTPPLGYGKYGQGGIGYGTRIGMGRTGLEPVTSGLSSRRSPS